jgi:hypothetical protein
VVYVEGGGMNRILVIALLSVLMAVSVYFNFRLLRTKTVLNEQLMASNLELGKAHTQFGNAQSQLKRLETDLANVIKERDEKIRMYGELEALYAKAQSLPAKVVYVEGPTVELPIEVNPGHLFLARDEHTLVQLDKIPGFTQDTRLKINCVAFPTLQPPYSVGMSIDYELTLRLKGILVQTIASSGAVNHYVKLYEIDESGEEIGEFELTKFNVIVTHPEGKKFFWWAPHVDLGFGLSVNDRLLLNSNASIGFSPMGFGLTKNDLTWKFLRIGFEFSSETAGVSLDPVMWNAGSAIPLISNLWVSPFVSVSVDSSRAMGLHATVGL